jgi:hypothetical protein
MAGALCAPLAFAFARARIGRAVGVTAAWLVGLSPLLIWYAQEARSYSALASTALIQFVARLQEDRTYYAQVVERLTHTSMSALLAPMAFAALIVMAAALVALYFLFRRGQRWMDSLRKNRAAGAAALALFVAMLAVSVYPRGHSAKRQLLILWPYVIVLMAWWWPWGMENRRRIGFALGLSLAAAVATIAGAPKDEWRETTAYVTLNAAEGDALATLPGYQWLPFNYYSGGRVARVTLRDGAVADALERARAEHGRLWVAFHTTDRSGPNAETEQWLKRHATLAQRRSFYHIDLRLYTWERP